jgi:hypothetical protein
MMGTIRIVDVEYPFDEVEGVLFVENPSSPTLIIEFKGGGQAGYVDDEAVKMYSALPKDVQDRRIERKLSPQIEAYLNRRRRS